MISFNLTFYVFLQTIKFRPSSIRMDHVVKLFQYLNLVQFYNIWAVKPACIIKFFPSILWKMISFNLTFYVFLQTIKFRPSSIRMDHVVKLFQYLNLVQFYNIWAVKPACIIQRMNSNALKLSSG